MTFKLLKSLLEVVEQKNVFSKQKEDHWLHPTPAIYETLPFLVSHVVRQIYLPLLLRYSPLCIFPAFLRGPDEIVAKAQL